jgi:hypothetical protein
MNDREPGVEKSTSVSNPKRLSFAGQCGPVLEIPHRNIHEFDNEVLTVWVR